ncbi:MAG: GGDEF domain-containing protein [Firmicutes bacterium]|jgi:diguanylate cyclase (GGDEF)-like protein|nr:GGDEF domain-containing protein [Bacillota bacterium]NLL08004.1 GGDEF domain-containing protein [Bacillota bacterium]HBG09210.1 hypothetical protein [Bacillota bacterium]
MEQQRVEQLQKIIVFVTAAAALVLGVVFYNGAGWRDWPVLIGLSLVFLYLQTIVVRIGERSDYSLATASVLPIVYLFGPTPAMAVSVLAGIADGWVHKKQWWRVLFNSAQLAISAFTSAVAFEFLQARLGGSGVWGVLAMMIAALVHMYTNIALVARMVAVWRRVRWWYAIKMLSARSLRSSFSSALIGLVFTLFIRSYGFWGVVAFGVLMINLSGMLKAAVEVSSERARRKELEEELLIDEMTDAFNFRFLNQWLNDHSDTAVTVLFCDLDDFSDFNNEYGHAVGDSLLKMFVKTIVSSVRPQDRVARYGGDEFVVILEGVGAEGGARIAERIMANLKALKKEDWGRPVTVSVGIASKPAHTSDKHQLLLFSDQAMYAAKAAGKNTLRVWSHECAQIAAAKEDPC